MSQFPVFPAATATPPPQSPSPVCYEENFDLQAVMDTPAFIIYTNQRDRVPSVSTIAAWTNKWDITDAADLLLRAVLKFNDQGFYSTFPMIGARYFPPSQILERVPPSGVPSTFSDAVCFEAPRPMPQRCLAAGTLIPAGPFNERAIIVGHLCQQGYVQYLICFHGHHDMFLLRVSADAVVNDWPDISDLQAVYHRSPFGALFRGLTHDSYPNLTPLARFYHQKAVAEEAVRTQGSYLNLTERTDTAPWFENWGQERE